MPTKREREYYAAGYRDGRRAADLGRSQFAEIPPERKPYSFADVIAPKRKRKLSAWNKYVKNKRNHITYRDGKLNLKKMAVAFRRKKRR